MCGIVGYVGSDDALNIVLNSLKNLEYRGYDSSGVAYFHKNNLVFQKSVGEIKNLQQKLEKTNLKKTIVLGHTRWATHGENTTKNAHPHCDKKREVMLVHNGIIENYIQLKNNLKNISFLSQTDTEVVAQILGQEINFFDDDKVVLNKFLKVLKRLKGSYAFAVMFKQFEDKIFFAKQKSPLIVGVGQNFNFVASDIGAFLKQTNKVINLEDGDYGYISKKEIKIFNNQKEVNRKISTITENFNEISIGKHSCFMEKEISEGGYAIKNTLLHLKNLDFSKLKKVIKGCDKIFVTACGTALHAGMVFKYILETKCKINVILDCASEFRYKNFAITKKSLCIFISQSGETADTLSCALYAKKKKAFCVAITNVLSSRITKMVDFVVPTFAGIEIAVASTKAYLAQLCALYYLIYVFCDVLKLKKPYSVEDIFAISKILDNFNQDKKLLEIIPNFINNKSLFFVGRGQDYLLALEGALKLKEISYIHCEAFAGGELKHGSLSLIDEKSYVFALITQKKLADKMLSNIVEMKSRGAKIILFSQFKNLKDNATYFIPLKKAKQCLMPFIAIKPLQELALLCTKQKGLNPDKPRNLAKSVTVE